VLTSEHEGTPNVLLEAMATGLPVIATNVGGVPEIVEHGRTGFLVAEDNFGHLVNTTRALIQNSRLRAEIGTQARSYVEECHSVHRLPAYLADLYEMALGTRMKQQPEKDRHHLREDDGVPASVLHFAFRRSNDH
jgi:colanic acid/amylovoran biosynthesis glycosyltransferase